MSLDRLRAHSGVKLPSTTLPPQQPPQHPRSSASSTTPLTDEALATLGRQLDEASLANALHPCSTRPDPVLGAIIDEEDQSIRNELAGFDAAGLAGDDAELSPTRKRTLWSILQGNQ